MSISFQMDESGVSATSVAPATITTRYLVLRANAPIDEDFALSSPRAWSEDTDGPTELSIDIVDATQNEAGELRADPYNAAVMDADVALRLISPTSTEVGDVGDETRLKKVGGVRMPDGLMAVGAHTTQNTGQGVTVAVLDTGIDDTHPAFEGKTFAKHNFTKEGVDDQDVSDLVGHGTHCAATICGVPVDNVQVGVAPGVVRLCVGKVLTKSGGTLEMLLDGMYWAVFQEKASVVSMSLGYDLIGNGMRMVEKGYSAEESMKVMLRQHGEIKDGISKLRAFLEWQSPYVVFIAATGNESERPKKVLDASLPASELFPIGAVGPSGGRWDVAPFSNGGAQLVAPGVEVLSAAPGGGWAVMSGTSMATPHVAGVAALWTENLRNQGTLQVADSVRSNLKANAVMQPLVTKNIHDVGSGMVQAPQG
jgi:subtilisin family serine protease